MTTNLTPTPEPTSLNSVVVGNRNGETVVAVRADNDDIPWMLFLEPGYFDWHDWPFLRRELTDIHVVPMAEVARPTKVANCARCDRIEAHALGIEGLLGRRRDQLAKAREEIDQLKARIDELEGAPALSDEQVEALRCAEKWLRKGGLAVLILRDAFPDAFEPEPEPGADIPDEVVNAAWSAFDDGFGEMRAALAAADAKRGELEGQA